MGGTMRVTIITVSIAMIATVHKSSAVTAIESDGSVIISPQIESPVDEVVLKFGESKNITCKAQYPIVWRPFERWYEWIPPNISISFFKSSEIDPLYGSTLTITNASALMVGRYYCVRFEKQDEDLDELITENMASSIYVYVEDPHQPIVPMPLIYHVKYDKAIIPCKPSHPDVELEVCRDKNCVMSHDPSKAFVTPVEQSYSTLGNVYCKAKGFIVEANYWTPFDESIPKPSINSNIGDLVPFGKNVQLTCRIVIFSYDEANITWKMLPIYQPKDKSITIGELIRTPHPLLDNFVILERELIIKKATLAHKRIYRCEVSNGESTNYHNFKLHVRDTPDDFVILSAAHNRTIITGKINRTENTTPIHIIIQYKSYPVKISYQWFKNYTRKIVGTALGSYTTEQTENYLKLTIKRPDIYDSDNYTLVVRAGTAEAKYNVAVIIHDKPQLSIGMRGKGRTPSFFQAKKGEAIEFPCYIIAHPLPEVKFMFQPCMTVPWKNCSIENDTQAAWHAPTRISAEIDVNYAFLATYRLIAELPGIVYCMARNSQGNETTQAYFMVIGVSNYMHLERVHPEGLITVGDNVIFNCAFVRSIATAGIDFIYNGENFDGTNLYDDGFIGLKQLTLLNVNLNHSGDVSCNATTMFRKKYKQSVKMEVTEAIAPQSRSGIIHSNLVLNVDVLTPIHLECDVLGVPDPHITWLKNGTPIESDNNIQINSTTLMIEDTIPKHTGLYECRAENKKGILIQSWNVTVRCP